jgi:hypothetical protein
MKKSLEKISISFDFTLSSRLLGICFVFDRFQFLRGECGGGSNVGIVA